MKKKSNAALPTSFLQKTFDMLSSDALSSIVSWSEEGTEFIIYNTNEFSEKVLPTYFKHSNFASFIRQLNMYDFHKLRSSSQEHIYKHPKFIRGHPEYLKDIHRKTPESAWPLATRSQLSKPEMSPVIKKLVQMHQSNINYHNQITSLEDKVSDLTKQNKILADQLWENQDRMKNIEKALLFFANCMKGNGESSGFGGVPALYDNMLQIAESSSLYKRQKVDEEDYMHSPLELFEDDLQFSPRAKMSFCVSEVDGDNLIEEQGTDKPLDVDKLDFLLDR